MRLTKVDGVTFYKEKEKGKLKLGTIKNLNKRSFNNTLERVEKRYNEQIESRIYNEFFRINGKGKIYNSQKNGVEKYIEEDTASLAMFILELYSGKENNCWGKNFSKINLANIKKYGKEEKIIEKKYKFQYKLNETVYLFKEKIGDLEESFSKMLSSIQQEAQFIENESEIRALESYKKLKNIFKKYKERKIKVLVNSIEKNKSSIIKENSGTLTGRTPKEKYFLNLLSVILTNEKEPILENILKECCKAPEIEKLINNIENLVNEKRNKKEIIEYVKKEIKSLLYIEKKDNKAEVSNLNIFSEEFLKYIKSTFSKKKFKPEQENNEKRKLEQNSIEKYLCIENNNGKKEINRLNFLKKIKEGFKNRLTNHMIDYGKILYYIETDTELKDKTAFETLDLEYIKAKESLTRKLATLISFSTYSFYNIFNHEKSDNFEDILKEKNDITKKISSNDIIFNEKKLNYFFDGMLLEKEINKTDFIGEISENIYNFRNSVIHFKPLEILQTNMLEIVKYYEQVIEKKYLNNWIIEKFSSNNLYQYYTKEDLIKYFNIYKYRLIKTKAPFAPNFRRILIKGEKLYQNKVENNDKAGNIINYKKLYEYFWNIEKLDETEELKEYKRAKDFLLSEMYYNNFYSDFLSDTDEAKKLFSDAIKRAKDVKEYNCKYSKTKKDRWGNPKREGNSGLSYNIIENFDKNMAIGEYIANIHKEEMNRIEKNEKYNTNQTKSKAEYLNEFLEDVFLEGFILWINKKYSDNLFKKEKLNRTNQLTKIDFEEMLNEKELLIDYTKLILKKHTGGLLTEDSILKIQLYSLLSMQDNKRIVEFENEIIKFSQYKKNNEKKFFGISFDDYFLISQLVLLTRERLNSKYKLENEKMLFERFYECNDDYQKILENFIEKEVIQMDMLDKDNQLYYQTDCITPILHSNLEKTRKFGTQDFLSKIVSKYSKEEKAKYNSLKNEIKNYQTTKAEMHKKWTENLLNETNDFNNYKEICRNIRKYNYLEHKQTLQNVYDLHKILSDIQGRFIAFINKYERDFKFIMLAIENLTFNEDLKNKIRDFLEPRENLTKHELLIPFNLNKYEEQIAMNFSEVHKNFISQIFNPLTIEENYIRNYIAHFRHFTDYTFKKSGNIDIRSKYSFIDQMNYLIELFSYDKKTKNYINKSLKTILEKYNIEIKFELENDKKSLDIYKIAEIKSKKGKLLGKENEFELLEKDFINEVKKLLNYKAFD